MATPFPYHLPPDRLLLVGCVARLYKIAPRTLRRWIATGLVPAVRIGRRAWAIRASDLERLPRRRHSWK
jgi:predicted site-specific integrase-resolvase